MTQSARDIYDITVVGGGLAGLTAALALAPVCKKHALRVSLIAPKSKRSDGRTTALLMPAIKLLENLGVWDACKPSSAPLSTMRMIDGSRRLIRAPLTDFKAGELGLEAFGYNVPNVHLADVLEDALSASPVVNRISDVVTGVSCKPQTVELTTTGGLTIETSMVAAADGRQSPCRIAAGIETRDWSYPQTAVVTTFHHTLPHNDVSTEFHTETGPFTQVPLPPQGENKWRSSLVWMVRPDQTSALMNLSKKELSLEIEKAMQSCLGVVEVESTAQTFPIVGMAAKRFATNRIALLGEAGHVFPPIGAQGLNLGLRDVVELVEAVVREVSNGRVLGSQPMMDAFHSNRAKDVFYSTGAVDMLNRSLLADFLPVQAARALGLATLGQFGWLRRQIMKRGFGPADPVYLDGNISGGNSPVAIK